MDHQGNLADGGKKNRTLICVLDFWSTQKNDLENNLSDRVMFDGASKLQLGGKLLKIHCTKLKVMRGVEHTI